MNVGIQGTIKEGESTSSPLLRIYASSPINTQLWHNPMRGGGRWPVAGWRRGLEPSATGLRAVFHLFGWLTADIRWVRSRLMLYQTVKIRQLEWRQSTSGRRPARKAGHARGDAHRSSGLCHIRQKREGSAQFFHSSFNVQQSQVGGHPAGDMYYVDDFDAKKR